ncbi:MAG TPA: antibiotic biosynthesis monooxygenase family protein [Ktedonobacteraceae bacterium]|jgi:quinol monooxygenase YgiN|nr:antibiotic biosynthesis monooxygenase family protein [Ktedonobacteraceae bacterium]
MTTISLNNDVVTTINTFTVEPQHQQRALELLIEIARQSRQAVPGFLSANFHKSTDGTRVVNYAQFANQEAVQQLGAKILGDRENPFLAELRAIATPDSRAYELCAVLER